MIRSLVLCPIVLASCIASAAAGAAEGRVFDDRNGNGRPDAGEPGVAGVVVSNGRDVVRTDARGAFAIADRDDHAVFVVKPPGWRVGRAADAIPAFWHAARATPADFPLQRAPARKSGGEGGLDVLVFADPQPKSRVDVDYYDRDIVEPLVGRHHAALGLSLGDIVDDDLSLYPGVDAATARLGVPWLHAPGNHDMDAGARDDDAALHTFRGHYGPDTYAWEEPAATFVLLDDVIARPGGKPGYVGGFREDQLAFLAAYLPLARKDRLLVVGVHIPLLEEPGQDTFRDADRERLFALLRDFPHVLLLSAHKHTQQHVDHGAATGWHGATPLHEYNVGAACGAFWSGAKDAAGIPDSTMADGTPNGYATLSVRRDGGYALAWHPARLAVGDAAFTEAMALHAPQALRHDAYPAWGVYADVFMGRDDSRVEYRIDGGEWRAMARVAQPDPRLLAENARDDAAPALRGYDRSPEAKPSAHLWRGTLPTDLAEGEHRIEVRAFDPWQGEQRASTRYRLIEATP